MLKITAPVLSVGIFAKTWRRETIKKTVAKRYQFMENFGLLFGLLTPCYVAERIPTKCCFKITISFTNVKWKHLF